MKGKKLKFLWTIVSIFLLLSLLSVYQLAQASETYVNLTQTIEKYFSIEEKCVILQQAIYTDLNQNEVKKEKETLRVEVPVLQGQKPEAIDVLFDGQKLEENSYRYNEENNIVEIKTETNQQKNQYKIIYRYPFFEIPQEIETISLKTEVITSLEDHNEITNQEEKQMEIGRMGQGITLNKQYPTELSKGYLYHASERTTQWKEKLSLEISVIEEENLEISEQNIYLNEEYGISFLPETVVLKETSINKDNFMNIFGEEGRLIILKNDNQVIAEINKDTEADEDGNIIVSYEINSREGIKIQTTAPKKIGTMEIIAQKEIKGQDNQEGIQAVNSLQEITTMNQQVIENKIALKEPTLQASIDVDRENLATMIENKEVTMGIKLDSKQDSSKLYKNPIIQVTMPEEIENISLVEEPKLFYEEELKIVETKVEGRDIYIRLEGEQTSYKSEAKGAFIFLKANITLNKKATNRQSDIIMRCSDSDNEIVETTKQIDIISSREMITVNTIESLGNNSKEIETVGEEENKNISLETAVESKPIKVTGEIINNNGHDIENVRILGELPTDNNINNLGTQIQSTLNTTKEGVTIYYTGNENATQDIEKVSNKWQTNLENMQEAKKFLIVLDHMTKDESISFDYYATIPENLGYKRQASLGYTVYYTADKTQVQNAANATEFTLTTGEGPIIEGKVKAMVGGEELQNNAEVKRGEVIRYSYELTNVGTEEATNITIESNIPAETIYVEPAENFEYIEKGYYTEIEKEAYTMTLDRLGVGESKTISFEVRVKSDATLGNIINTSATVHYLEVSQSINSVSNKIADASLRVTVKRISEGKIGVSPEEPINYHILVDNLSTKTQDNIELQLQVPEGLTLTSVSKVIEQQEMQELEINEKIQVGSIEQGKTAVISIILEGKELGKKQSDLPITATLTQQDGSIVHSNVYQDVLYGYNVDFQFSATNENEYLHSGEQIEYKLQVKNNGLKGIIARTLITIPEELTISSAKSNGQEIEITEHNIVDEKSLEPGEMVELSVIAVVNYSEGRTGNKEIVATAELSGSTYKEAEVKHILQKEIEENPNDPSNPNNPSDPSNPSNPNNQNNQEGQGSNYSIEGKAWEDTNEDGKRDETEGTFSNLSVRLVDTTNNQVIKTVTTDTNGSYKLDGLNSGHYMVVFEYDSTLYRLTAYKKEGVVDSKNSDVIARTLTIDDIQKVYATTDTIEISDRSISNIDIGLIKAEQFDLKIDKTISRIILQTAGKQQVYSYTDSKLAKVELDRKTMNGTKITVEYLIKVSNVGEIDGYAKKITDYIPEGFTFNTQLNKDWYQENGKLITVSLANEKIPVGQSKTLKLSLTKTLESEGGYATNKAEITDSYNDLSVTDQDTSNNVSQADILISIKTGKAVMYTILTLLIITMLAIGVYMIKIKVVDKRK